jgi:hypothetical protein
MGIGVSGCPRDKERDHTWKSLFESLLGDSCVITVQVVILAL